jgi:hypothetical protein
MMVQSEVRRALPPVRARAVGVEHPLFQKSWGYTVFFTPQRHGDPARHLTVELARRGMMAFVLPPRGEALAHALLNAGEFAKGLQSQMLVVDLNAGLVRFVSPAGDESDCYVRTTFLLPVPRA